MASKSGSKKASKRIETLVHEDASRTNIPSAEHQSVVGDDIAAAVAVAYERRNRDLDPQLVWRGKDTQDLSDSRGKCAATLHTGKGSPKSYHRRPQKEVEMEASCRAMSTDRSVC